jgi:hypothetical protein
MKVGPVGWRAEKVCSSELWRRTRSCTVSFKSQLTENILSHKMFMPVPINFGLLVEKHHKFVSSGMSSENLISVSFLNLQNT